MNHDRPRRCRARVQLACAVEHCFRPAQGIGKFCQQHDKRMEQTGDPQGRTIRKSQLAPYVRTVQAFIGRHRDHPGIVAALAWLEDIIQAAPRGTPPLRTSTPPPIRVALWLSRLKAQGIAPVDVLTVVAAMHLLRDSEPRAFATDRHFRHQTVIRVLRLIPGTPKTPRLGSHGRNYSRITVGVREHLGGQLLARLGLLCLNIARSIDAAVPAAPSFVAGSAEPFTPTNTE